MKKSVLGVLLVVLAASSLWAADPYERQRQLMVDRDLKGRGIVDRRVLEAMTSVPRHLFVPSPLTPLAYRDGPLPIGEGQTISQPYIVALMTELLRLAPADRVLEIGTGSGYAAAVLACVAQEVYTIEIKPSLASAAAERLQRLGYANVRVRAGDGYQGWPEAAPFDAIVLTAYAGAVPQPLIAQLKEGGRIVAPLGNDPYYQVLTVMTKRRGKMETVRITPVAFVPMTGEAQGTK